MWELLQKLENLGWKPYGKSIVELSETEKNVRLLTSLSSGLWQFVCENGIIENGKNVHDFMIKHITYSDENKCGGYSMCDAEYYIMMSALCDEDKLEQILLDNIKI